MEDNISIDGPLARRAGGAKETVGGWWQDWDAWLGKQSGRMIKAREPGAKLGVIEPAPGAYVKVRFDKRED